MIEGVTKSGFEFHIKDEVLDNMELVDAIAELDTNPTAISSVTRLLLGDQKEVLYDHLRTKDGRVPIGAVSNAVTEMMAAGGKPAKN